MNKYKNKKIEKYGKKWDSQMELEYYEYLLKTFTKEEILIQPKFELQPKFSSEGKLVRPIYYIADFQINELVVDVKGMETTDFNLKKKMFKYKYPELELKIITKAPKYLKNEWVELEELKKIRKNRKSNKK